MPGQKLQKLTIEALQTPYSEQNPQMADLVAILRRIGTDFGEFSVLIYNYTLRQLTLERDILNVAQAMLRKFSTLSGVHCFEGLPPPFERFLSFRRTPDREANALGRRKGFPSYSWTGWKSGFAYGQFLLETNRKSRYVEADHLSVQFDQCRLRCWIIWYCKFKDGSIYRIDDRGGLTKSLPPKLKDTQPGIRYHFQQISVAGSDLNFGINPVADYPPFLFWTICINLRIGERAEPGVYNNYNVVGGGGKSCGRITMDVGIIVLETSTVEFAIIAVYWDGFYALPLNWENGVAERQGTAKLNRWAFLHSLAPGPRWKPIVLG
jgi:hypothetical protein